MSAAVEEKIKLDEKVWGDIIPLPNASKPRPLIGVTGISGFQWYVQDAVEAMGLDYAILTHNDRENRMGWLNRVNGLILVGGADIHPSIYHQNIENDRHLTNFDIERDVRELDLIYNFKGPILGICRGHQLLGVYHGLRLLMDITDSKFCHNPNTKGINNSFNPTHQVTVMAGYEVEKPFVNSYHHQAIEWPNSMPDTIVSEVFARIDDKSSILEGMSGENWLSVQWHPELDWRINPMSNQVWTRFANLL